MFALHVYAIAIDCPAPLSLVSNVGLITHLYSPKKR